jgi:hypothetical protein
MTTGNTEEGEGVEGKVVHEKWGTRGQNQVDIWQEDRVRRTWAGGQEHGGQGHGGKEHGGHGQEDRRRRTWGRSTGAGGHRQEDRNMEDRNMEDRDIEDMDRRIGTWRTGT